jgi:hypothetical protein
MKQLSRLVALVALVSVVAVAQPGPGPGDRGWERVEQLRKVRLIEMLDLKEDQSVRFFARFKEHEAARKELTTERNEVLDKIERLVRNRADSTEYAPLFAEVEGIDTKIVAGRKQFFSSLGDILTIEQRAKLLLFERRFERELRDAFREAQRRRHGTEQQP